MKNSFLSFSPNEDSLAIIMILLVFFIGLCVCSFASRYLRGDAKFGLFFIQTLLLLTAISIMVSTDSLIILALSYGLSNLLLVRLMVHKASWKAAKASGMIAIKNYLLSISFMVVGFVIFYFITGTTHIQVILHQNIASVPMTVALTLILIAALAQSAIWPFHRWLISSLNSPTPVSALMHAGLINGGGFLLVRFAPLYLQHPRFLAVIFVIGLVTALLGTLWKLMQNDVKRMLACSTMGQMGFMFAQCGLGLFPAAVSHLVWHGMFKAYLFLASGSAAQEKRVALSYPPQLSTLVWAMLCGFCASMVFGYVNNTSWLAGNTTLVLMVITFIAASQFSLTLLMLKTLKKIPVVLISSTLVGLLYALSVHAIAWLMAPMQLMQPQPLNTLHIIGIIALTLAWLSALFSKTLINTIEPPSWFLKGYVYALNTSQPHPKTVTTHRNQYEYQ